MAKTKRTDCNNTTKIQRARFPVYLIRQQRKLSIKHGLNMHDGKTHRTKAFWSQKQWTFELDLFNVFSTVLVNLINHNRTRMHFFFYVFITETVTVDNCSGTQQDKMQSGNSVLFLDRKRMKTFIMSSFDGGMCIFMINFLCLNHICSIFRAFACFFQFPSSLSAC